MHLPVCLGQDTIAKPCRIRAFTTFGCLLRACGAEFVQTTTYGCVFCTRTGQAKAWPHWFDLGAIIGATAMPHLCNNSLRLLLFAPRTALAKARAQLFTLGAFFVLRALLRLKPKRGGVTMGHHWR
jgi:hypothetical protein